MPSLQLTVDPGFEDLTAEVLAEALPGAVLAQRPFGLAGHLHVGFDGPAEALDAAVRGLRGVHHVVRPLDAFDLGPEPLAEIRARVAALAPGIPELQGEQISFRVSSARSGTHSFTSEDVARVAGAGVRERLPRAVRMKGFDVELRCDVRGARCLVGLQWPGPARSRRDPGPFRPKTSLRASVAWALLRMAGGRRAPTALLDPFAGAGSIPVEAAALWPGLRLAGSDLHADTVAGLATNLAPLGGEARQGDARRLETVWPEGGFDRVVTNLPFGRRMARDLDLPALYAGFLASSLRVVVPGARLVALSEARGAVNEALRRVRGWRRVHVRVVEMGGVYVGVFVLERA